MQLLSIAAVTTVTIFIFIIACVVSFAVGYQCHNQLLLRKINKASEELKEQINAKGAMPTAKPVPEYSEIIDGVRYSSLDAKCIAQGGTVLGGWTWLMQPTTIISFF